MVCNKCGSRIEHGARFCARCGAAATDNEPTVRTPSQPSDPSATVKSPHPTPPSSSQQDPLIGQTIDRRYLIRSRLGTGGMGAVYRAERLQIGDEVAIKILKSEALSEPQAIERFRRE